jgi:hypothetical protein
MFPYIYLFYFRLLWLFVDADVGFLRWCSCVRACVRACVQVVFFLFFVWFLFLLVQFVLVVFFCLLVVDDRVFGVCSVVNSYCLDLEPVISLLAVQPRVHVRIW